MGQDVGKAAFDLFKPFTNMATQDITQTPAPPPPPGPSLEQQAQAAADKKIKDMAQRKKASQTIFTPASGLDQPSTASQILLGG